MRNKNAGIGINETPYKTYFLSPAIQNRFKPDPNATEESPIYKN